MKKAILSIVSPGINDLYQTQTVMNRRSYAVLFYTILFCSSILVILFYIILQNELYILGDIWIFLW